MSSQKGFVDLPAPPSPAEDSAMVLAVSYRLSGLQVTSAHIPVSCHAEKGRWLTWVYPSPTELQALYLSSISTSPTQLSNPESYFRVPNECPGFGVHWL